MWLLFHRKQKTRTVRGGETLHQRCSECGELATFREVEVTEKVGVFIAIDVASSTERAFQCTACGEVFDVRDDDDAAAAPAALPAAATARDLLTALEAEQPRRDEERRRREVQVDDELAALKRKLGL